MHLEGTVEMATLRELDAAAHDDLYRYTDFAGFIQSYVWVSRRLTTPESYALIARRFFARLREQNVAYAEVNLSVGVMLWKRQDVDATFAAVRQEALRSGVAIRWIFDAVRHFGVDAAWPVAELACKYRDAGVVGFGIGGDETRGPVRDFADVFRHVTARGVAVLPHAGETCGPDSIWQALEAGAVRIGHGIRAIDDPVLCEHLRRHDIPLEVCISSNVCTGAVASLAEHPVRRLYDAGVPITLNSDDPAMFHTTLAGEYEIARREFGFTGGELRAVAANGFRYARDAAARDLLASL